MVFGRFMFAYIIGAAFDLVFAATGMVWLGIAHGFDERVPAFGYWTCFFLIWALGAAQAAFEASRRLGEAAK